MLVYQRVCQQKDAGVELIETDKTKLEIKATGTADSTISGLIFSGIRGTT